MHDEKITALPAQTQAVRESVTRLHMVIRMVIRKLLKGPVGKAGICHDRTRMDGTVRFKFDRDLYPAIGVKARHQAGLIELMGREAMKFCCRDAVTGNLGKKEVAIVGAESVMRLLPEVRFRVWLDQEARTAGLNAPNRGLIHPSKQGMKALTGEPLEHQALWHAHAQRHRMKDCRERDDRDSFGWENSQWP
jgi:hypothetical protein